MKPERHFGYIKNGKLHADSFKAALRDLNGRALVLTVAEFRNTRSNPQNRYYWGVVVYMIRQALVESGWEITHEATHETLKFRFLKEDRPVGKDGEFITTVRSTTDLDTQEFSDYVEKCIQFAAEYLNVVIPPPLEQTKLLLSNVA